MKINFEDVFVIKTGYGEEVIAKIANEDEEYYSLVKPQVVVASPQGIQMIPGMFTADPDSEVIMKKAYCAMISLARREVADGYLEAVTGIRPVSSKILMG